MLSIPVFAIAYMLKGGWLGKIQGWDDSVKELGLAGKLLSGKLLAGLVVFLFCAAVSGDWIHGVIMTAAWVLAVPPSMGEEAGAIGRLGHWWGDYKDAVYSATFPAHRKAGMPVFDRSYGVIKGVQRGAWIGAVFTVAGATYLSLVKGIDVMPIELVFSIPIMTVGFVAAHFIGQEIYYRVHKQDSWAYAEPIVGVLIGLCYALSRGI